jgi:predicted dehydrogenase
MKVAVAGCGYFSQFHRDAWARLPVEVVGLCDPDLAKAEQAASGCPGTRVFTDAAEMLDETRPDILDIVTPPATHAALIALCAEHGIPAICQKPLAPDWDTAATIVEAAERAALPLVVHENFRFMPWFIEVGRMIEAGEVGEPLDISFRLRSGDGQGESAYLARQPYFRTMRRFLVHETVIHLIDVFRFLFGEVAGVFARLRRLNPVIVGEDAATVLFSFANERRSGIVDGNRLIDHPSADPRMTNGVLLVEGTAGRMAASSTSTSTDGKSAAMAATACSASARPRCFTCATARPCPTPGAPGCATWRSRRRSTARPRRAGS